MKSAIIVFNEEDGLAEIFESIETAERYIEAIDVSGSEEIYDSESACLKAQAYTNERGIELTSIDYVEPKIYDVEGMRRLLIGFLKHFNFESSKLEEWDSERLWFEAIKHRTE